MFKTIGEVSGNFRTVLEGLRHLSKRSCEV